MVSIHSHTLIRVDRMDGIAHSQRIQSAISEAALLRGEIEKMFVGEVSVVADLERLLHTHSRALAACQAKIEV